MRDKRTRLTRGSGAALTLIALALWLRLLVPAGWMPSETGFGLRPCTPPATAAIPTGHHAGHGDDHRNHHPAPSSKPAADQHSICPFTALAMAMDAPPPSPLAELAPLQIRAQPALPRHGQPALGLPAPPPPSTGPPYRA